MKWLTLVFFILLTDVSAQKNTSYKGTFVLSGTGSFDDSLALKIFVRLLPEGAASTIVFIPTASSGIKLPNGFIFIPPRGDTTVAYIAAFENELQRLFGVQRVRVLHTRSRPTANTDAFTEPIHSASGVWISSGNAGRLANTYLGTKTQFALKNVVTRGGILGGNSAGAIILGSYIVRGWTEKPMLMAKGHDKGFGFLPRTAINPHVITAKREYELISVVHEYPKLLGLAIDDYALLIIRDNVAEVHGTSKVAIYDNVKHGERWYYWLAPGDRFDLDRREKLD